MSSSAYQRNAITKSKLLAVLCVSVSLLFSCGGRNASDDGSASVGGTAIGTGGASAVSTSSGGATSPEDTSSSLPSGGSAEAGGSDAAGGTQTDVGGAPGAGGTTQETGGNGDGGATDFTGGASSFGGANATGGATAEPLRCSNPEVISLAAGDYHTCALMENGGVRCWGYNLYGQLGDGTTLNRSPLPSNDVLTGVKAIAAGGNHTCALMQTGGVRCWGDYSSTPPTTDVLTGVKAIAAGAGHTCALTNSGGVRCWGANSAGQLGNGTATSLSTPPVNDVLTGVQSIAASRSFTCALMTTGAVRCWGAPVSCNCPDVRSCDPSKCVNPSTTPGEELLTEVRAIAAREDSICAVMMSGGLRCWDRTESPPETDIITGVRDVAVTGSGTVQRTTCALMETGGVRCWGYNYLGLLGDGTTTDTTTPPASDVITSVKAITAGGSHICALMETGGVYCWGSDSQGQLGQGTGTGELHATPTHVVGTCE